MPADIFRYMSSAVLDSSLQICFQLSLIMSLAVFRCKTAVTIRCMSSGTISCFRSLSPCGSYRIVCSVYPHGSKQPYASIRQPEDVTSTSHRTVATNKAQCTCEHPKDDHHRVPTDRLLKSPAVLLPCNNKVFMP
jgi:hypothetical protein